MSLAYNKKDFGVGREMSEPGTDLSRTPDFILVIIYKLIIFSQIRADTGEGHYINFNIILKNIKIHYAKSSIKIKQHKDTALIRD